MESRITLNFYVHTDEEEIRQIHKGYLAGIEMEVKVTIHSQQLSKEELQLLLQAIRDCEQKSFPDKEIVIWIDATELTREEATEILTSIKPPYKYGPIHVDLPPEGR